jgi:outer membrane protein assembly complex protein YaeT
LRRTSLLLLAALLAASSVLSAQNQERQERIVRRLSFVGNRALDDYALSSAIATTSSSWFATNLLVRWLGLGEKRYFDELEFRRDVVRLLLLYRQSGYMTAVVDTSVVRTARDAYITFRIYEGDPVRVARLDVQGVAAILDTLQLRRALPLQVGDPFNRFLLQASADTIVTRLRNHGYPYAEVLRNFDSEAGVLRAEVTLEAIPGRPMRVGAVMIHGLEDVDTATVRRLLTVRPGERFRQDALYQSQRDLYGMGVFSYANVVLVDSLPPAGSGGSGDSTVRVLVQVQEGPRRRVRFGLGYGSVECWRAQTGWTANDFVGGARTLELSARLSKIGGGAPDRTTGLNQLCNPFFVTWTVDTLNYTLAATLRQPAFLSRAHTATVGLFAERRSESNVYTREAIGANAEVTFNARRAIPVTVGYSYSVGRTQADPAVYCSVFQLCDRADQEFLANRRAFAAVTVTGVRDRVNSPLDPTHGNLVTASVMHASRIVGSDPFYEFNRGEVEIAHYYSIGRRTVASWRLRAGTILPQRITLSGQSAKFVPPDQRFYGGGPNSVRGYGRNELGPRVYVTDAVMVDSLSNDTTFGVLHPAPIGGNSLLLLNAELRLPSPLWSQRMRLALFVDVGRVWQRRAEVFAVDSLRITPGVGLRVTTPLGPVRLDLAYNGYGAEQGPIYLRDETTGDLTLVGHRAAAPPPRGLRRRLVLQFAVGQAF